MTTMTAPRTTADVAVDEVIEDAIQLIRLHHQLQRAEGEARDYLQIELETQITVLRVHAQSAEEVLDAETDKLPDDE